MDCSEQRGQSGAGQRARAGWRDGNRARPDRLSNPTWSRFYDPCGKVNKRAGWPIHNSKYLTPFLKHRTISSLPLFNKWSRSTTVLVTPLFLHTMAIETTAPTFSPPSVFDTQAQRPRPQDVGILGIEMYFPQRVRHSLFFLTAFLIPLSASPSKNSRFMMASQPASTLLALANLSWRSRTIGRTSTLWHSPVRRIFLPITGFNLTLFFH